MNGLLWLPLTLTLLGIAAGDDAPTCMKARNRCVSRIGCSMALNNFHIACEEVKLGIVDHCTDVCMSAVVSLVTVDDDIGTDYLTCDCDGNEDCKAWKTRIAMCSTDVLKALESLDNDDSISCSLARMLCEADTQCWTAMSYYEDRCSNLWSSHSSDNLECTSTCNNSLSILYRQTKAAKLKNCLCDNTDPMIDERTCLRMKYNTETYCLNHQPDKLFKDDQKSSDNSGPKENNYDSTMKVVIGKTAAVKGSQSRNVANVFLTLIVTTLVLIITFLR